VSLPTKAGEAFKDKYCLEHAYKQSSKREDIVRESTRKEIVNLRAIYPKR
jgi:hypothetical protein